MMAVTPFSFNQRNRRRSSARRMAAGEERLDGVEDHAFGADTVNRASQPGEQPFEVILARLLDLAALDVNEGEHQLLPRDQRLEVTSEGGEVGRQLRGVLLEGHEDTRLAGVDRAAHEEFHCYERLATAGATAQEGWPPLGQPAAGEFVQALNAGGRFGQRGAAVGGSGRPLLGSVVFHESLPCYS
jgi:hypothetical protein